MKKNTGDGLPKDLSEIEDGQHSVLVNPILEITNPIGQYVRRSMNANYNDDFSQVWELLVLLGTYSGYNWKIPPYYRITRDHLTGVLSLMSIKQDSVVVTDGGKIIDIF